MLPKLKSGPEGLIGPAVRYIEVDECELCFSRRIDWIMELFPAEFGPYINVSGASLPVCDDANGLNLFSDIFVYIRVFLLETYGVL